MDIGDIERRLAAAQERLRKAGAALAGKHKGGEWEECQSADQAVLLAECVTSALPSSADNLKDRFLGCLLGCAVGDALGAPFEGLWSHSIPDEEACWPALASSRATRRASTPTTRNFRWQPWRQS